MKKVLVLFFILLSVLTSFAGTLKVHFIDVGQADSIFIQTPNGKTMLIDAGKNDTGSNVVDYLKKLKISKIDVIVGTHPHEDHIGGMDYVIDAFDIGKIYMPKVSATTKTFEDVLNSISAKNLKITTGSGGKNIDLDKDLKIDIIAPNGSDYEDMNDNSIVIKLTYNNISFLFEGDAESESEKEMLDKKYDLKADVLKVGHHGSNSSTSQKFLNAVSPKYAVIQVGENNDYHHPHPSTTKKLERTNVEVYRTDLNGTIIFETDGKNIKITSQKKGK